MNPSSSSQNDLSLEDPNSHQKEVFDTDFQEDSSSIKKQFFNNIEKLFNFFVELNQELNSLYKVCFINPSIVNFGESLILKTITDDKMLILFREHFNHFGDYEKFINKDVEFYKNCLLNEIVNADFIPTFYKNSFKQNIETIFNEGYLEEDHIENLYEYCKQIIKYGILYNDGFALKDERWKKI